MTILLFISAYVLNVFLNRWLNKIAYQKCNSDIDPIVWFLPIIPTLVLIYIICIELFYKEDNWFNGKNW